MKMDAGFYQRREILRAMAQMAAKLRWMWLSLLWSGALLSGLLYVIFGPTMSGVVAAMPETVTDTPAITFSASTYTINEGADDSAVILLITPTSSTPITVSVSSANIQAEAPEDFEGLRQSLVISPSAPVFTLPITLVDDALVEGVEGLVLTLSNYQGVSPGGITETTIIIEDNDVAYLSVSDVVANEGDDSILLLITQSTTSTLQSVVDFRTIAGSATSPEDFETIFSNVSIPPGSTQATVTVLLNEDDEVESTESFIFQLEDPLNAELANITATVTILDDDLFPELGLETAEANESDGLLPFIITLSSTWAQTITVDYTTLDGSAIAPADYLTSTGVLTISPGSLTATVPVSLVADQVGEGDENLFLLLTNPVQAVLSANQVEGIINDGSGSAKTLFLPGLHR